MYIDSKNKNLTTWP